MQYYRKLQSAHSNQTLTMLDGVQTQRYGRLERGVIQGDCRNMQVIIADEKGFDGLGFDATIGSQDDSYAVVNLFDSVNRYIDSVAIAGADDADHAIHLALSQFDYLEPAYATLVANEGDGSFEPSFDSLCWESDTIAKLMNNRSQDRGHYLPIITQKMLVTEKNRVTHNDVLWDGANLVSHEGDYSRLLVDIQKNDSHHELTAQFDMAGFLANLDVTELGLDALMDTNNRLDLMKERLFRALAKQSVDGLSVTDAVLTKPFKKAGMANVAMQFNLSDGQTFTILFHNPDADPKKLSPQDTMVSWKWMLNKRDITAAVSPKNGENVQLAPLATRMMKVAKANSKRFAAAQSKKLQNQQALTDAQKEVDDKKAKLDAINAHIAELQTELEKVGSAQPQADDQPKNQDDNSVKKYSYTVKKIPGVGRLYVMPTVGKKFSEAEINEMMGLLDQHPNEVSSKQVTDKGNILVVLERGGNEEETIESIIPKKLTNKEQKTIDDLQAKNDEAATKANETKSLVENNKDIDDFIKKYFVKKDGSEFLNDYNRNKLIKFLNGEDDTFQGVVNGSWAYLKDTLPSVIDESSRVNWELLKQLANNTQPTEPTNEQPSTPTLSPEERKLNNLIKERDMMKDINKITRMKISDDEKIAKIMEFGIKEDTARTLATGEGTWDKRQGFAPYELTSVNNRIKTLQAKVDAMKKADEINNSLGGEDMVLAGVSIILNKEADRIQLDFPSKPSRDVIAILKKNGWKWSPSNQVWQRQLTENAMRNARTMVEAYADDEGIDMEDETNTTPQGKPIADEVKLDEIKQDIFNKLLVTNKKVDSLIEKIKNGGETAMKDIRTLAKALIETLYEDYQIDDMDKLLDDIDNMILDYVSSQPTNQGATMTNTNPDADYLQTVIDGSIGLSTDNMKQVITEIKRIAKAGAVDKDLLNQAIEAYQKFALSVKVA